MVVRTVNLRLNLLNSATTVLGIKKNIPIAVNVNLLFQIQATTLKSSPCFDVVMNTKVSIRCLPYITFTSTYIVKFNSYHICIMFIFHNTFLASEFHLFLTMSGLLIEISVWIWISQLPGYTYPKEMNVSYELWVFSNV